MNALFITNLTNKKEMCDKLNEKGGELTRSLVKFVFYNTIFAHFFILLQTRMMSVDYNVGLKKAVIDFIKRPILKQTFLCGLPMIFPLIMIEGGLPIASQYVFDC